MTAEDSLWLDVVNIMTCAKSTTMLAIPHLCFVTNTADGLAYIPPVEVSMLVSFGFGGSLKRSNQELVTFLHLAVAFRQY